MNWPGAIVGPSPSSGSRVRVHVSDVSCLRSETRNGAGTSGPGARGSAIAAVAIDVEESKARPLEALDQHLREAAHQLVADGRVVLALLPQAPAVEGRGTHHRQGAGVEVPPVRSEEPRPAEHLSGFDGLDRHRTPRLREQLDRDTAVSDQEERLGLVPLA